MIDHDQMHSCLVTPARRGMAAVSMLLWASLASGCPHDLTRAVRDIGSVSDAAVDLPSPAPDLRREGSPATPDRGPDKAGPPPGDKGALPPDKGPPLPPDNGTPPPDKGAPPPDKGPTCGNGKLDPGEQCDGSLIPAKGCKSQGHAAGSLSCTSQCKLSVAGCYTVHSGGGVALAKGTVAQSSAAVASDGSGYLVAWTDARGGVTNIYAARVTP